MEYFCTICKKHYRNFDAFNGHKRIHSEKVLAKRATKEEQYKNRKVNLFNGFLDNKYTKCYYRLIEKAQQTKYNDYTEKHHIIPRSLRGTNTKENLVILSAREHFICHLLLCKMVEKDSKEYHKMINAFMMMLSTTLKLIGRSNSTKYSCFKQEYIKHKSLEQSGLGNSQYGTVWIVNVELRDSRRIKKEDVQKWLKVGYIKGCIFDFDLYFDKIKKKKNQESMRLEKKNISYLKFKKLYDQFINSNLTYRAFVKLINYPHSFVSLYEGFKRHNLLSDDLNGKGTGC